MYTAQYMFFQASHFGSNSDLIEMVLGGMSSGAQLVVDTYICLNQKSLAEKE